MSDSTIHRRVMELTDERWRAFVAAAPGTNTFHHAAWSQLLADAYGARPFVASYRPFVAAVCDGAGEIQAGLPVMEVASPLTGRRWISLPFTDHCEPLIRGGGGEVDWRRELIGHLDALRQEAGIGSLQLRTGVSSETVGSGEGESLVAARGVHFDDRQVLHRLALSADPDEVYATFHRSQVQRSITRAERDGVEVRWGEGRKDLDLFYDLHVDTRRRQGVPVQPKRYFDLLQERLLDAGLGFVLLAYAGRSDAIGRSEAVGRSDAPRPIAGAVFLTYKPDPSRGLATLIYKYGASDAEHWSLRPNHALFWSAIKWGCENGYDIFDWGKTSVDNEGLRRFKGQWGAEETPLVYAVYDAERGRNGAGLADPSESASGRPEYGSGRPEYASRLSGRLSGLMETVIQHSPKFVCRTLGEVLYKHFA